MTKDQLKIMCALYSAFKSTVSLNSISMHKIRRLTDMNNYDLTATLTMLRHVGFIQRVKGSVPTRFALTAKGMTAYERKRDEDS